MNRSVRQGKEPIGLLTDLEWHSVYGEKFEAMGHGEHITQRSDPEPCHLVLHHGGRPWQFGQETGAARRIAPGVESRETAFID